MNDYRRNEAWMGRYAKRHKPRRNLHALLNSLFTRPRHAFGPGAVITQEVVFPDVSFYQGNIDWDTMASKAGAVIIRAGQNLWTDIKFHTNYLLAKVRGIERGVYFFYDDRVSPGKQAALLVSLIKDDLPDMEVWVDWENSYGGAYRGLQNVVAMMQEIERLLPSVTVGLYTGYYFFRENSNPITNASQYNYLKNKRLWLAFYSNAANVLIPAPWTKLHHWQCGTPTRGLEYGCETLEIDLNFYNGTLAEFAALYGDPDATPIPPDEEPMTIYGRNKTSLTNIRAGAGVEFADIGDLLLNDRVEADRKDGSGVWWHLTKITRNGANMPLPLANCWAYGPNIEELPAPAVVGRFTLDATARFYDAAGNVVAEKVISIDEPM